MHTRIWKVFFVVGIPILAVLTLLEGLDWSSAKGSSNLTGLTAFTETITTTLEAPVLSPTNTGMCSSGWLSYTNELSQTTNLALNYNLSDAQARENSGIWQPDLPKTGVYRVEALIPDHPPITWDCPPDQKFTVDQDTSAARYQVHSLTGEKTVLLDQSASNGWQPLGEFMFDAGTDGYVELTNLTSEESLTRTVSFSGMRFIWLRPSTDYLPVVLKNTRFNLELRDLWSSDPSGNAKYAFLPDKNVVYHFSGTNPNNQSAAAQVEWTLDSDTCGSTKIFSGPVNLKPGDWEITQSGVLPKCTGLYTQTLQLTSLNTVFTQQSQFVVNNPSRILLSDQPAFDRCYTPNVEQMQAWKNKSPYDDFNLYIGGISYGCDDQPLDPVWIHQVSQQGWSFILTWVGPQAPCSKFLHKMSNDPNIAYVQGRLEAEYATGTADQLGLMGNKIIYYDLESYSGATTSCRDVVKKFIQGWVEQLHDNGYKAGFYGSPCTSYIKDWATVSPPPDDVWIAYWTEDAYTETVNMLNVPCLDTDKENLLWTNHQRIRQYTGGHRETYGGVSLVIDSNIADGEITTMQPVSPASPLNSNGVTLASVTPQIQDMQLLPDGQGWTLVDGRLYWSTDGGQDWQDRTPKLFSSRGILGGYFLDADHGWFVLHDSDRNQIFVLRTQDGGKSWQQEVFDTAGEGLAKEIASGSFDFIDKLTGWLAFKLQSSSNFSLGVLFGTTDGGRTWKQLDLPIGEAVQFVDAQQGWVSGGVSGSELYRTVDGGQTWQAQNTPRPETSLPGQTFISPPVFETRSNGSLVVTYGSAEGSRVAIYQTGDGGNSWKLSADLSINPNSEPGSALPVSGAGSSQLMIAAPGQGQILNYSNKATVKKLSAPGLPEGTVKLSFANPDFGWAQVQNGECNASNDGAGKMCRLDSYLMMTQDGGRSWRNISPGG